jgi:hypothetical protein
MYEINDGIIFLDSDAIEMLANSPRQLFLALPLVLFATRHGWGMQANASRLGKH